MNYPIWEVPASGLLIAFVAIVHVVVSHFAVGGGLFLVLAERKARRENDEAFLGWLKKHSRFFILLTLVFGAMTGVGIWFTIALVSPQATSSLINSFVWGWAMEWTLFITEIAAAMVYFYGWDRLPAKTHLAVGWVYFVAAWGSLAIINGILTYMLTPGAWVENHGFWSGFFNPTYFPSLVMRTFVSAGLAGVYAILTAAWLSDPQLKARIARYAGFGWVLPMAVAVPFSLLWYLVAALRAGVPAGEILGAKTAGVGSIIGAILKTAGASGYPPTQRAALTAIVASALVILLTVSILGFRAQRYGRLAGVSLLVLSLIAMGGGEWMREGLRKPYVIGQFMFVNGLRLPAPPSVPKPPDELGADPFALSAVQQSGVLAASRWSHAPAAWATLDSIADPRARADVEDAAGREVFKLVCSQCHTYDGYLAVRPLVRGQTVAALERVISKFAEPVNIEGQPTVWSDPRLRLKTWLGRRMPPFPGTDVERRAVAVHLARVGGTPDAGAETPAAAGLGVRVFDEKCAMCHGPDADWPIARMIKGRDAAQLYDALGRLDELNETMPPFDGTDDERRALADHLAGMKEGQ